MDPILLGLFVACTGSNTSPGWAQGSFLSTEVLAETAAPAEEDCAGR